jgi:hypothetical protein
MMMVFRKTAQGLDGVKTLWRGAARQRARSGSTCR